MSLRLFTHSNWPKQVVFQAGGPYTRNCAYWWQQAAPTMYSREAENTGLQGELDNVICTSHLTSLIAVSVQELLLLASSESAAGSEIEPHHSCLAQFQPRLYG